MAFLKNVYLLTVAFFIISTGQSIAQNEMLFHVKFKPNKTYITNIVNNMQMEMDFDADSAKRKQMESTGMKLPMHMDMLQEMTLTTKTDSVTMDKRIPMTMTYDKVGITMTMNGNEMKQPDNLAGMKIKAYASEEGSVRIDTVEGQSDAVTKQAVQKMISQMLQGIVFPNKRMKIGDTFMQNVPMEMPVSGNTLNILATLTYTLKEIKGSLAFFDYTQSISIDLKKEKVNSKAAGSGKGKMIYDMPGNYITNTTGDMIMDMNLEVGEMAMKMNLKAKTSMKAKVL